MGVLRALVTVPKLGIDIRHAPKRCALRRDLWRWRRFVIDARPRRPLWQRASVEDGGLAVVHRRPDHVLIVSGPDIDRRRPHRRRWCNIGKYPPRTVILWPNDIHAEHLESDMADTESGETPNFLPRRNREVARLRPSKSLHLRVNASHPNSRSWRWCVVLGEPAHIVDWDVRPLPPRAGVHFDEQCRLDSPCGYSFLLRWIDPRGDSIRELKTNRGYHVVFQVTHPSTVALCADRLLEYEMQYVAGLTRDASERLGDRREQRQLLSYILGNDVLVCQRTGSIAHHAPSAHIHGKLDSHVLPPREMGLQFFHTLILPIGCVWYISPQN